MAFVFPELRRRIPQDLSKASRLSFYFYVFIAGATTTVLTLTDTHGFLTAVWFTLALALYFLLSNIVGNTFSGKKEHRGVGFLLGMVLGGYEGAYAGIQVLAGTMGCYGLAKMVMYFT